MILAFACQGVTPTLEWTTTRPEVRSPYSADGMPRMTSTSSMLSADTCRRSVPAKAVPEKVPWLTSPLFDIGTPSTTMLVPKAMVELFCSVRSCRPCCWVRSGRSMSCPGMSCMTSASDVACRWSMAWRPMTLLVEAPLSRVLAVTVTSFSASDDSVSTTLKWRSRLVTLIC